MDKAVIGHVKDGFVEGSAVAIGTQRPPEDLIFCVPGDAGPKTDRECLRFKPDGTILVQGRLAASDLEVVDAVRQWAHLVAPPPLCARCRGGL
jgi:hypothetical protein